jgi:quinohemoprotein ethanol dehydrogenase
MVDGKQYVSIAVGWGGVYGLAQRATDQIGPGTVYTFVLDGKAPMPSFVQQRNDKLLSGVKYNPADIQAGTALYVSYCVLCHGVPGVDRGGNIPNLGYMDASLIEHLDKSIFKGPAMERGMPDFSGKLSMEDVQKLKAFIQGTVDSIRANAKQ